MPKQAPTTSILMGNNRASQSRGKSTLPASSEFRGGTPASRGGPPPRSGLSKRPSCRDVGRPAPRTGVNDRMPRLDPFRHGSSRSRHLVEVDVLEHHHPDGFLVSALQAKASALRASIAWRAEELARLVEEGAPHQQIDAVARTIAHLQARLQIHEIGLRETGRRNER